MLPVGPSTVKSPAPISRSSPIQTFLVTAKPPAVYKEAPLSVALPASSFALARTFSTKLVTPATSRVPSNCELSYTLNSPPIAAFLVIEAPPDNLRAPSLAKVAVIPACCVLVPVTIPVTPNVFVTLAAPFTSRVPSTTVLPEAAATVNLVELISKLPETDAVPPTVRLDPAPLILTVEASVEIPDTPKVPATVVLPVVLSTLNLLLLIARSFVTSNVPVISTLPPNEASSPTTRSSPTYKSRPMPAPPPTMRAPLEALVAAVVSKSLMLPASIPDLVPENTSEVLVAA